MTHVPAEMALRALTTGDTAALVALARAAFDVAWSDDFVAWKYFRNPAGSAFGAGADSGGRVVAAYSNLPLRLKRGDATVTAAQAVDAMVLAEYRRQKLFYQLARLTYQSMDQAGISLTYVFPAPAIRAAFVNQLGYVEVGPVPRFVSVVRPERLGPALGHHGPRAALDRFVWRVARAAQPRVSAPAQTPGPRVSALDQFDERFDRLWPIASADFKIATVRDRAYLTWRYRQNPLRRYVILAAARGAELAGYAILALEPEHSLAQILEFIVAPGDDEAGLSLLAEAARRARQAECAQVQCWMLLQHRFYVSLLRRGGFVFWPGRAVPNWLKAVTPFIVRPGPNPSPGPDPARLDNWFLSMGDHDYY